MQLGMPLKCPNHFGMRKALYRGMGLSCAHVVRIPNAVERRCVGSEIVQKQNKYEQADLQCLVAGTRILASVLVHATSHFIVRVGTWWRWDVVRWKCGK